jgi:hypothetical protein
MNNSPVPFGEGRRDYLEKQWEQQDAAIVTDV